MPKILLVTCIVSPHQIPLACCLASAVGEGNFRYVATQPVDPGATAWTCTENHPWILKASESENDRQAFLEWWKNADVVICGDRRVDLMQERITSGKLTFYMSERWWKPPLGMGRMLHPGFAKMALKLKKLATFPCFHYLPIGSFAAADMKRLTRFPDRMWLWGYFTALPDPLPHASERQAPLEILYAGRMLSWKRVDTLIRGFGVLQQEDPNARLSLIGDGPTRPELEQLADRLGLRGHVIFQSTLPMEAIWRAMRTSHVYALPSNGYEGWGAVVNEAMAEGCAVVASDAAGAARTMIHDGENGLLFRAGNWRQLGELLIRLSMNEALRLQLAMAGQKTITDCWSPKIAAERFMTVSDALLSGKMPPGWHGGPMSREFRS
jgi:glycosyltransferase involved in cell wall biosynthesis